MVIPVPVICGQTQRLISAESRINNGAPALHTMAQLPEGLRQLLGKGLGSHSGPYGDQTPQT